RRGQASGHGRGRRRRCAEHLRDLRLGSRAREDRVRRAEADVRTQIADITIYGAGMAGLCAAARARELGAEPVVLEKGSRPGGSMLLSSCVVWRYRTFEDFRAECPGGDEELQRAVFDGFDEALEWLVSLGPEVVW